MSSWTNDGNTPSIIAGSPRANRQDVSAGLDQPAALEGDFQNKVDFAFGHLDQIFPIRKSVINTNYIARFNNGVQSSDSAFREGGYSVRCVSEYFVRSQHFAIQRHATMNDDRASVILDDVRHGVPPRHTANPAAHCFRPNIERKGTLRSPIRKSTEGAAAIARARRHTNA
jgi:hypothetical protein